MGSLFFWQNSHLKKTYKPSNECVSTELVISIEKQRNIEININFCIFCLVTKNPYLQKGNIRNT